MRFLVVALFVMSVEAGATLHTACEPEMSRSARALNIVVRSGVKMGAIQRRGLEEFIAAGSEDSDPFGDEGRSPENLALKQKFAKFWNRLSAQERISARQSLLTILENIDARAKVIGEAQEQTSRIIKLKEFGNVNVSAGRSEGGTLIMDMGWLEGRPILQVSFRVGQDGTPRKIQDVLYDPFHPQQELQQTPLPTQDFEGYGPQVFESGGTTYASFLKDGFFFDAAERRTVPGPKGLKELSQKFKSSLIVKAERGYKLYATLLLDEEEWETELVEIDLSAPELRMRTIAHGKFMDFVEHKGPGFHFFRIDRLDKNLPLGSRDFCIFRIPSGKEDASASLVDCIQVPEYSADIYEHGGKIFAVHKVEVPKRDLPSHLQFQAQYTLRVRELFSKVVRKTKVPHTVGSGEYVELNGVPYFVRLLGDGVLLMNLLTLEEKVLVEKESFRSFSIFMREGRPLLLCGNHGSLKVLDLEANSILSSLKIEGAVGRIIPFEYNGDIYAFVGTSTEPPILVQITGREKVSGR